MGGGEKPTRKKAWHLKAPQFDFQFEESCTIYCLAGS
jgi:hypothetical protein